MPRPDIQDSETRPHAQPCYAHSNGSPERHTWEPLDKHLGEVASLAAGFAAAFGSSPWGEILGLCHDLGKYSERFQAYLRDTSDPDSGAETAGRVDHSTYGARVAAERFGAHAGRVLAFCIAGHHAGLANAVPEEDCEQRSTLEFRLNPGAYCIPAVGSCPLPERRILRLPFAPSAEPGFELAFFTRMLFSCLVDADRLATEAFCDPQAAADRRIARPTVAQVGAAFSQFLQRKQKAAPATLVNRVRADVLEECRAATGLPPGFFSLNVPTGGGKTYASLGFALRHAERHNLRRVVVAVPFTTITEQTADAYRAALGDLAPTALIEHHSGLTPARETRANQLGAENWDAPLVVTTNVQLFESLFASATTPCRKLHRLAGSVIILDEAQTLPVELLRPALAALRELVAHYGATVVLCTATQPALERSPDFPHGLQNVRPIVTDPQRHFERLKRVIIRRVGTLEDEELARRLAAEESALCILNTRRQALRVFERVRADAVPGRPLFHLSTWMCPQHRREVLEQVRRALATDGGCVLVSTQLVEAGVDLDFPVVYRAEAGFDSIAQAAGRCNREGRLPAGTVYLFESPTPPPRGLLRDAAQAARELRGRFDDPTSPPAIHAFFQLLYWSQQHQLDHRQVLECFRASPRVPTLALQFRHASERFRMIRDVQVPIFVPYDEAARELREALLRGRLPYLPHRLVQPYLVPVLPQAATALRDRGATVEHDSGLALLLTKELYCPQRGLLLADLDLRQAFLEA